MTDTITKFELAFDEQREKPRMLQGSLMGVSCNIAATFPLLLPQPKAADIERFYLTNPAPKVELTVRLGAVTNWTATGKFIGLDRHSVSSAGNAVWDVIFEPDDKGTLAMLNLRMQQAR